MIFFSLNSQTFKDPCEPGNLLRDPVNVPVTFALDLPTHGTAVAQRKQLLLLPLLKENQSLVNYQPSPTHMENTTCSSAERVACVTDFVPRLDGEEDVWEKGLRSDGAVESDDTGQEGPEDHQDVDVPAGRSLKPQFKSNTGTLFSVLIWGSTLCSIRVHCNYSHLRFL